MSSAPRTYIEVLHPSLTQWNAIRDAILRIEQETFGETSYSSAELETEFLSPSAVVVLLRDADTHQIVGYMNALADDDPHSMYLSSVALLPTYRGHGSVGPMTTKIEKISREQGYRFLTTDAVIANGYADAIERHYGHRIVEKYEHESRWGRQRFFKIRLTV